MAIGISEQKGDASANHTDVSVGNAILTLHEQGWSNRRIAKELGIHRDTVARHVRLAESEPATNPPLGNDSPAESKPATNPPLDPMQPEGSRLGLVTALGPRLRPLAAHTSQPPWSAGPSPCRPGLNPLARYRSITAPQHPSAPLRSCLYHPSNLAGFDPPPTNAAFLAPRHWCTLACIVRQRSTSQLTRMSHEQGAMKWPKS